MLPPGDIKIESCGLDVEQGIFSPSEAIKVGREFGVDLTGHRSKGLAACDMEEADEIIAMEYGQVERLKEMLPAKKEKIRLLRDFAPWPDRLMCNIFDPCGLGESEFRRCFQRMGRALDGLKGQMVVETVVVEKQKLQAE